VEDSFGKYRIAKSNWWSSGSFKVFDDNHKMVFRVTSPSFSFSWRKTMSMYGKDNNCLYTIENVSLIPQQFKITDAFGKVTLVEKHLSLGKRNIHISSESMNNFTVNGNSWSNKFEFLNEEEEMALLSVKVWTAKDYGIVIKNKYSASLIICVACVIAYLKESGQI